MTPHRDLLWMSYPVKKVALLWKGSEGMPPLQLSGFLELSFHNFFSLNLLSSAKSASRGQFSAPPPTKAWNQENQHQWACWVILEALSWAQCADVHEWRDVCCFSACGAGLWGGWGAPRGQALCKEGVCAHCTPASQIATVRERKIQSDFLSSPD